MNIYIDQPSRPRNESMKRGAEREKSKPVRTWWKSIQDFINMGLTWECSLQDIDLDGGHSSFNPPNKMGGTKTSV